MDSSDRRSIDGAKEALRTCRIKYKRISFFLEYFFPNQAKAYNAPPKYEAEEPFMEYEEPHGLQYIESMLFGGNPVQQQTALNDQVRVIMESAKDLRSLVYHVSLSDAQIMESLRIELIRIMTLYIAGYDAPYLKSGIAESLESLRSLQQILLLYLSNAAQEDRILSQAFQHAIFYLKNHPDFNSFDRLKFLSVYAIPVQHALGSLIDRKNLGMCSAPNLDYAKKDLFSGEIIGPEKKAAQKITSLGKKLFDEKALSGNFTRACSGCHQPGKYYTDQLSSNISFDHRSNLRRNTPSLMYAAFQTAQFWDGRAKNLQDHIIMVLKSPEEMNNSIAAIEKRLNGMQTYKKLFKSAFAFKDSDTITIREVASALGAFLRTLGTSTSDFDKYMQGNKKTLTPNQKKGFNLFMGKAQCGTCHFVPLFNGLTPPLFNRSEYEVLGVPASDHLNAAVEDKDSGRYAFFPSPFYRSAFKTPTLRNITKTNPYMHNGAFKSLATVMDFYNRGGGAGLGIQMTNQTLPREPLHLTKDEIKDIILFLGALIDKRLE